MDESKSQWDSSVLYNMEWRHLSSRDIYTYCDSLESLYDSVKRTCESYSEKLALIDNNKRSVTYKEFLDLVDRFALYLKWVMGIQKGSHIGVMLYNSIDYCAIFLALNKIGAVLVPLPSKFKPEEIKTLAGIAEIDVIICEPVFDEWFSQETFKETKIILETGNPESDLCAYLEKQREKIDSVNQLMEIQRSCEDEALLMFTSGTTSNRKGVMLKNYNIMHAVESYRRILNLTPEDISLLATPIYHITGLVAVVGLFLHTGGTLYLHKYFDAGKVLDSIRNQHITFLHASPTVFFLMLREAEGIPIISDLKTFACGSSNMPAEKIRQMKNIFPGSSFRTVYGLTETTSPATIFPEDAGSSEYIGSSGIPIPGVYCEIRDDDGNKVPDGDTGEIYLSGATILDHYYNMSTQTLEKGWLATGDIGYKNSEGYIFIVDRKKDMINRGGEKICSFDVENVLHQLEGIDEAAVVGIPDEIYGEVAAAIIKILPGYHLTKEDIQNKLIGKIAKYKIPVDIRFVESIPLTKNNKVDKKMIRQYFLSKYKED